MAWEHVLLGNLDPSAITQLQPGIRGALSANQSLIEQCALLDELGRNPGDGDIGKLRASYPGVPIMRLPGSGLIITAGELNVLPDYLSGPEAIITAPAEFLLPLVQAVRAQTYRHFQRMLGRRRVSRREWSTLRYPDVRVLPDIRESIEIDGLGKRCALPAPERYLSVLARNACHFAPFSWYRWQSFHVRARQLIAEASEAATEPRRQRLRCTAQVFAGYADHFLQDSFAAGHLVNKTLVMQWYVEWLTHSGSRLRDRELLSAMTCERQPGLHGPDLYRPHSEGYEPASLDPQTAVEAPTLDARIDLSGVRGTPGTELCLPGVPGHAWQQRRPAFGERRSRLLQPPLARGRERCGRPRLPDLGRPQVAQGRSGPGRPRTARRRPAKPSMTCSIAARPTSPCARFSRACRLTSRSRHFGIADAMARTGSQPAMQAGPVRPPGHPAAEAAAEHRIAQPGRTFS